MGVGIRVENLNAWYGKTQALYDIDLQVRMGEIVIMTGPTGSGKTTLLTLIAAPMGGRDASSNLGRVQPAASLR